MLPGKLHIEGCYRILPAPRGGCLREVDLVVEVSIFGIGGVVERHVAEDLRRSYDVAADYTHRWIAQRLPRTTTPATA